MDHEFQVIRVHQRTIRTVWIDLNYFYLNSPNTRTANTNFSDFSGPCQVMISKVITWNKLQVIVNVKWYHRLQVIMNPMLYRYIGDGLQVLVNSSLSRYCWRISSERVFHVKALSTYSWLQVDSWFWLWDVNVMVWLKIHFYLETSFILWYNLKFIFECGFYQYCGIFNHIKFIVNPLIAIGIRFHFKFNVNIILSLEMNQTQSFDEV